MREYEINEIRRIAEDGQPISRELALSVLHASMSDLPQLFSIASSLRDSRFGNSMRLCSILNARSGACSEDCAFCAQASCHQTGAPIVPLFSEEQLVQAYEEAAKLPITHFGVVTSGGALSSSGVNRICRVIARKSLPNLNWCASLGCLDHEQLSALKMVGLKRFHHNLETARSFFPQICTTHTYDQRLETVRSARKAGLEVCCGGIVGVGESLEQRVEFAETLASEVVDSIPLNFLIPVSGTRLEHMEPMKPLDMLRTIIMFRLTNPRAELRVCGGRTHLRDLQSMVALAGVNGMMIGPLLTTAGRSVEQDLQMLRDLEAID
jgi:biotin synthase